MRTSKKNEEMDKRRSTTATTNQLRMCSNKTAIEELLLDSHLCKDSRFSLQLSNIQPQHTLRHHDKNIILQIWNKHDTYGQPCVVIVSNKNS